MILPLFKKISFLLLLFYCIECNYFTKDSECEKQKAAANRCINSFLLFCMGNKTRTECDGSLQSTIFIGSLCKYQAPCQSSTDDLVKDSLINGGKD